MQHRITIEGRFHPGYSLFGRWIRRRAGDRLLAQSRFVVRAALIALLLILLKYVAWGIIQPSSRAEMGLFFGGQAVLWVGYVLIVLVGRQPPARIDVSAGGLLIRQASTALELSHEEVHGVKEIDALLFHRHYRRYAATHVFVNRHEDPLLLLESTRGPVVLGLTKKDRERLFAALGKAPLRAYSSSSVDAA